MVSIPQRMMLRDQSGKYDHSWYHHNTRLAEAVRQWRETNTLTLVK